MQNPIRFEADAAITRADGLDGCGLSEVLVTALRRNKIDALFPVQVRQQCTYLLQSLMLGARCSVLGDWCQQIQQKLYSAAAYNKTSIANACRQPCAIPR